jgi:hypothetical protein
VLFFFSKHTDPLDRLTVKIEFVITQFRFRCIPGAMCFCSDRDLSNEADFDNLETFTESLSMFSTMSPFNDHSCVARLCCFRNSATPEEINMLLFE